MRRAGTRLIHIDDELIAKLARQHIVCRGGDGARNLRGELSSGQVGGRRGLLDQNRGGHELVGRTQPADRKIFSRALRLDAVIRVGRNLVFAERIALNAAHAFMLQP